MGLIATPATVASGAYDRALERASAGRAELHAVAAPELAPLIQAGGEVDERTVACVERACEPLRDADVDTVILGCTHYPLVRPVLQRTLGRGVEIVTSGEAIAAEVGSSCPPPALPRRPTAGASTDFLPRVIPRSSAGSAHASYSSRSPGWGTCGLPGPRRRPPPARRRWREARRPGAWRPPRGALPAGVHELGQRLRADRDGRHAGDLHRLGGGGGAALDARQGPRLGHGGVRDAPASTGQRKQRDVSKGRPDGRTVEIQRLIGRALRGVVDFERLGERTVWIDCDVLEADGGTRCASITGGYVALELALQGLITEGLLETLPLTQSVAAISCGMVEGEALLDLDYPEDSTAEVDMNVVMTGDDGLVEVQATAERTPLSRASLDELLALAAAGIERLRGFSAPPSPRLRQPPKPLPCGSCSPHATPTSCASSPC